jgi:hypothetical protein
MRQILKNAALTLASLAILGGLFFLGYRTWILRGPGNGNLHLRWHCIAETRVLQGMTVAPENVQMRLWWLRENANFIPTPDEATGRFALRLIEGDSILRGDLLSELGPKDAPAGGALVPVEVPADDAIDLVPGLRLAFAQQKAMIPSSKDLSQPRGQPAFTLLAIHPSPRDPKVTTLVVAVPRCRMAEAAALATNQWRPVILGPRARITPRQKTSLKQGAAHGSWRSTAAQEH